ncbi:hypothetical protein A4H97_15625 [Niastella yeongjuensis]|uniref:DUF4440 domain-containing protein n=1 Tax=Niastella yeongjuensis TaxID=354355 RepID=A0A1V9E4J6_9BACT|nr:nuclear transport factor 2 family protein [Niastella yeongjuensis]OQP41028.1 hypothetical protein A4H97_15625 [Niastella yeongjuensis]SEO94438.1 Putative lumazine-binding [Niastella yeongjuensis]
MKRFAILLIVVSALTATAQAQTQTTEDSVKVTINRMFEGMKNADTVLLKSAFTDDPILQTVATNKKKQVYIKSDKFKDFVKFIGDQKVGEADERIEFESIRIDGALAMVWAPYQFYYKGKFHHCGVNSFQLVLLDNNWKVQYLIDTRRKDCNKQ